MNCAGKNQGKRLIGKRLIAAFFAAALVVGLVGCQANSTPTQSDTLRVGVRSDVVGFGYYNNETEKYYGLEIDIAQEMAQRLCYKNIEFVTVTPDNRKETLQSGTVDCLVACYSTTSSREENFDFSPAYYEDKAVIMVEKSSMITSVDQLSGKTLGTMSGANTAPQLVAQLTSEGRTSGQVLSANEDNTDVYFDTFHLLQFSSYEQLVNALEVGVIDAACMDEAIAKTYMLDNREILSYSGQTQYYGVATQKDSSLSIPVNNTIQSMLGDNTIAVLIDKWD